MATMTTPIPRPYAGTSFISIFVSNSHLHWASHSGEEQGYIPNRFWRSFHLTEEDLNTEGVAAILSRLLEFNFGSSNDIKTVSTNLQSDDVTDAATTNLPSEQCIKQQVISVYVVSTPTPNQHVQEELLARMWETVPNCRFIVMGRDSFIGMEEDTTIGTADQLAILAGAVYFYGHPALVFDARQGLATTYYGTGCDGGISCLGTLTGRPPFARDVIQHWLTEGYGTTNSSSNEFISPVAEIIFNTERCIICTSRDEEILLQLRPPDNIHTDVTPRAKAHGGSSSSQYSVISSKHIIHYGIAFLIKRDLLHQCGGIASSSTSQPIDVMAGGLSDEDELMTSTAEAMLGGIASSSSSQPNDVMAGTLPGEVESMTSTAEAMASVSIVDDGADVAEGAGVESGESHSFGQHLGKRVAKVFKLKPDKDGDCTYRGEVNMVIQHDGQVLFYILYDDSDDEEVFIDELSGMLKLYEKVGEKKAAKATERRRSMRLLAKKKSNYPRKSNRRKASGGMPRLNEEVGEKKAAKTTSNEHLGKRVAKVFGLVPDDDGDCTYRGTVKKVEEYEGEIFYYIEYDDGDDEEVFLVELSGMLKLFEEVGEKKAVKTTEGRRRTMRASSKKKKRKHPSKSNRKKASGKENTERSTNKSAHR